MVLDGIDSIVGGTSYTYGVNNRFYAKRKTAVLGTPAQAREIVSVELSQTYNTNQLATLYDRQYQSNNVPGSIDAAPSHFSPVALSVRAMPNNEITANMRAEFDARYHSLRTISASGSYSWANLFQFASTWSKRGFIKQLDGFNKESLLDQAINAQTTVHTANNRVGGIYSFNYDILHKNILQQRLSGFYNAQCCGIAFEYQTVNWGTLSNSPITSDHRLFMSFTLAGLGNFSPFNGAHGGVPRIRVHAGHDSGHRGRRFAGSHLLDLLAGEDAAVVAWTRRAPQDRPCAGKRSICSIAAPSGRPSHAHGRPRCTTARRPRTSARRGTAPSRRSPSTCSAPIICAMRFGARTCACSS